MAAVSTPTIYDPKNVISFGSLPSGDPPASFTDGVSKYTVPNEAGAVITNLTIVNSNASLSGKLRIWHNVSGASIYKVRDVTIIPDYSGYPISDLIDRVGMPGDTFSFGSSLHGSLLLDLNVAELKD